MSIPKDELLFVPLGGAGEIGMNLNLYCIDGKWLMVDLGVSFGEDGLPGVDVVMPDPSFIEEQRDNLLGIVLTHGHEDHLGAVQHLWPRLRCPVYATPFTAALLATKLEESGLRDEVPIEIVPLRERFTLGPFDIEFISVTHSILEPNALAIRTRLGTILHTGDFKIDDHPVIGEPTDEDRLREIGDEGVLAMVCDSTNVFQEGESGSEKLVHDNLMRLLKDRKGRVAVTTFASNVARIETIVRVAHEHGRAAVLVGRSLWRVTKAARDAGYLGGLPRLLSDDEAGYLPDDKVLYICTGCQGEPRGAMSRIASGDHPHVSLGAGDLVIFSSKIIPGNERTIFRLLNRLAAAEVEVITEKDHLVHVSGHPSRDELSRYYAWVRPQISVPVHGELRHIVEHAAYARELQVPKAVELTNGAMLRLAPGPVEVVDHVTSGRLALDGDALIPDDSSVLRARRRLMFDGAAFVTVIVDEDGSLACPPRVSTEGVSENDDAVSAATADKVASAIGAVRRASRLDDAPLKEAARLATRREIRRLCGKRPTITVQLIRL